MSRVKRGVAASKRRKNVLKMAKGFRWRRSKNYVAAGAKANACANVDFAFDMKFALISFHVSFTICCGRSTCIF